MKDEKVSDPANSEKMQDPVHERGSLGLLALGAVGLKAWRQKREEVKGTKVQPK